MKTFANISQVPKRLMLAGAAVALSFSVVAAPLSQVMASDHIVDIETDTEVANVTTDTDFKNSVNAEVDQTIKVKVWYHNKENPGSGKIAENLRVAINGERQTGKMQTITGVVQGDNTGQPKSDDAQVNLPVSSAYLDYVEGSAELRYNEGAYSGREECQTGENEVPADDPNGCYAEKELSDEIVTGENGAVVNDKVRPCFAYEATVTAEFRVRESEVGIVKKVSEHDADHNPLNNDWKTKNTAQPGDKMDYLIKFKNFGNTTLENVAVIDHLPDYMSYVPGSTYIINSTTDDPSTKNIAEGVSAETDEIYQNGITVGDYDPGAAATIVFTVKIDERNVFETCGPEPYILKNVGAAKAQDMKVFYNTAWTHVNVACGQGEKPTPGQPEKPEQPKEEVPEEIPATGPASIAAGLFGTSALAYGAHTWVASRRRLSSLLNQ